MTDGGSPPPQLGPEVRAHARPRNFFEKISFAPLTNAENISIITPMIKKTKDTAAYRRVASRLKRLLGEGQVIEGSLSRVTAGSAAHWHLTRKVNGRTQTLYVPMSSVEEVRDWIRRWKEAKGLLKELGDCSRSILASSAPRKATAGGSTLSGSSAGARPRSRTGRKR